MAFSSALRTTVGCISRAYANNLLNSHAFCSINKKLISTSSINFKKATVNVVYILQDGRRVKAEGKEGDNLLDIAIANDVDIDGFGACEGTLACSTCHLIFKPEDFKVLPEEATDEELDMLDLAFELSPTSRLGCQVCVTKELDGVEVQVPAQCYDARDSP